MNVQVQPHHSNINYSNCFRSNDEQIRRNVLHLAAANGRKNIVDYLLKLPEIEDLVNAKNHLEQTPLHLAAKHLQCDVVQILSEDPMVNIRAIHMNRRTSEKMAQQRFNELEIISEEDFTANGRSTVQSQNNGVRTELRRRLTLKALRAARDAQVRDVEGILARHHSYRIVRSRRSEEMAKTLILIATVVATFTFAAGMTIPGGFITSADKHNGQVSLSKNIFFQLFIIFDATAMSLSMSVAVVVFWSLWWAEGEWFYYTLMLSLQLVWFALFAMAFAFITELVAVLSEVVWVKVVAVIIVCIFPGFLLCFFPLRWVYGFRWILTLSPLGVFRLLRKILKMFVKRRMTMNWGIIDI